MSITGPMLATAAAKLRNVSAPSKTQGSKLPEAQGDSFTRTSADSISKQPELGLDEATMATLSSKMSGEELNHLAMTLVLDDGISHTLWGQKPMAWIYDDASQIFTHLKNLETSGRSLRENFILLEDTVQLPDTGSGFIINKQNLRNLLNDHPEILDRWPEWKKNGTDYILEGFEKNNMVAKTLLQDEQTLGALLGYGPNNAIKFLRKDEKPFFIVLPDKLSKKSILHKDLRTRADYLKWELEMSTIYKGSKELIGTDSSPYKVEIPSFYAWDQSPETLPLMTRYLEDSWQIRDYFKAIDEQRQSKDVSGKSGSIAEYMSEIRRRNAEYANSDAALNSSLESEAVSILVPPPSAAGDFLGQLVLQKLFRLGTEPVEPKVFLAQLKN